MLSFAKTPADCGDHWGCIVWPWEQNVGKEAGGTGRTTKDSSNQITQRIDLNAAMNVSLPEPASDLKAVSFATDDGKTGWVLRLSKSIEKF